MDMNKKNKKELQFFYIYYIINGKNKFQKYEVFCILYLNIFSAAAALLVLCTMIGASGLEVRKRSRTRMGNKKSEHSPDGKTSSPDGKTSSPDVPNS